MKRYGWIAVVGVAMVLQPLAPAAQMDPSQSPSAGQPGPAPIGPNGSDGGQPQASSSMRESLGEPGFTGQQMVDRQFLRMATEEGIADVKLGELAIQKGGPEVKTFAQQIVADHVDIDKEMGAIADSLGVQVPEKMSKDDQAEYSRLNGLSGKDFDTAYVTFVLESHWKKLHDYYMEASVAANPDLAAEVVKTMKVMHDHLGMIEKTAKDEGIALPPRPPRPARTNAAPGPATPVAKQ